MMPLSEAIARELHALKRKAESARREAERAERDWTALSAGALCDCPPRDYVDGVTPRPPVRVALEGELFICDGCGRRWDGSDERKREALELAADMATNRLCMAQEEWGVYMQKTRVRKPRGER